MFPSLPHCPSAGSELYKFDEYSSTLYTSQMSTKRNFAGAPHQRPAIYLIRHVQAALRATIDEALAPTGLNGAQVALLSALRSEPHLSNAELARATFVTPQSMVPLLGTLEAKGFIVRHPHPAGGRAMPAELTPRGLEALQTGWTAVKSVEDRLLNDLSNAEQHQLRDILERCLTSLRADPSRGLKKSR
jgi:DNA-binding MarR family transcriptional regulator